MAQTSHDRADRPFIRATGEATVSVKPDRARLTIGVVSQATTAQNAAAQNAKETSAVIQALRRALGSGAEVQTSGYSLNPMFNNPKNGGTPIITGYVASNAVEVTTDDLANLGKLIDAGAQAGANNVRGVEFLLKNQETARAEALKQAAQKARASAEAIAAALGLKVERVFSAEQGEPQLIHPMRAMAMAAAPASTPIESGEIQVQATVTLTVEVTP